jgi:hypothetical protein
MNNFKKIVIASVLTFSLSALAFGAYVSLTSGSSVQLVDTSGQPNEWDVG